MSLVTRCPSCSTSFKVVRDQLRISDGWVRCGRCNEIFDATLDLLDTESGAQVPANSFVTPKAPPLDESGGVVPASSPAPKQDPFSSLQSDLKSFTPSVAPEPQFESAPEPLPETPDAVRPSAEAAAPALQGGLSESAAPSEPVAAPEQRYKPAPRNWPEAGMLDLSLGGAALATAPEKSLPQAPEAPKPATEPAWRRIHQAQTPASALPPAPQEVDEDEDEEQTPMPAALQPWTMRRASEPAEASTTPKTAPGPAPASHDPTYVPTWLVTPRSDAQVPGATSSDSAALSVDADAASDTTAMLPKQATQDVVAAPAPTSTPADDGTAVTSALAHVVEDSALAAPSASTADLGTAPDEDPAAAARADNATTLGATTEAQPPQDSAFLTPQAPVRSRLAGVWAVLALVALTVLGGQYLRHERDALSAEQPALRPLIQAICQHTQCEVRPPRRIDVVRIDGSSFTPARQPDQYELQFALRNGASSIVAMPSIELSLLDANERPVVRRIFHPADYGAPAQLMARGEQRAQLQLHLQTPAEPRPPAVVGYSLLAFYP